MGRSRERPALIFQRTGFQIVIPVRRKIPGSRSRLQRRENMRKSILTVAAIAASVFVLGKADAMPLNSGLGDAADRVSAVEKTQFVYLGRNYCWYPDGWHGPGFYWCGYAYRTGYGWGGPIGWHGWRGGGGRFVGPRGGRFV